MTDDPMRTSTSRTGSGRMDPDTSPSSTAPRSLRLSRCMTTPTKAKAIQTSSGRPTSSRMTAYDMRADARSS
eukprot:3003761-Heterocapsa_arctica.AAC.1